MKIFIDPGHSGPVEPGACAEGCTEADLNMRIARFTKQELARRGHQVRLTRDGPITSKGLQWRADKSNDWGSDLFLSIHCNSSKRIDAEGTETYHFPKSAKGQILARCIQYCITDALLTEDRGVKSATFDVLLFTDCPAVLIECGFLSNPVDRQMLSDALEQWRIGAAIAEGLEDYRRVNG
jgi:N-acetylmuramoyl-L-alanine amidase